MKQTTHTLPKNGPTNRLHDCFSKKSVKGRKCIIVVSTKFLRSQYKAFLKIITNFVAFNDFLPGVNWPNHWEKEGVLTFNLTFSTCCILLFNIFSWILLLNDYLQRLNLQIENKLDEDNTSESFLELFLMLLSWFWDAYILHIFMIHNNVFFARSYRGLFYATVRTSQYCQCYTDKRVLIFFKNGQLLWVILRATYHCWSHLKSWLLMFQSILTVHLL